MFRFGGFKASLNFSGRSGSNHAENIPTISTTKGVYRVRKDEFYGNGTLKNPTPRLILPSMVKLPPSSQKDVVGHSKSVDDVRQPEIPSPPPFPPNEVLRPAKSTGDLTQTVEVADPTELTSTSKLAKTKVAATETNTQAIVKTARSNNELDHTEKFKPKLRTGADVSSDPRGGSSKYRDSADLRKVNSKDAKKQEKQQKMIEKKRLAEQKKNEKLAAQERAKEEKLRKEQEKRDAKLAKQKAKPEKLPPSLQNDVVGPSKSVDDVRQQDIPSPPPSEVIRPTKSTGDLTQTVEVPAPTKLTSTSKLAKTKVAATETNTQAIVKTARSNNELDQTANVKPKLRTGADVSSDPRGGSSKYRDSAELRKVNSKDAKKQEKQQKMIEKKRLAEQNKNEKLAAQERAKEKKLRKEQEKREAKLAKQKAKTEKKDKGKNAPVPMPRINPLAQGAGVQPSQAPVPTPAPTQASPQYATNTLESSISRTSGPPAYADIPTPKEQTPQRVQNENDATGNTSFTKKVDSVNSWDLIAEHRQQITRPGVAGGGKPRQKVMDLQYHTGKLADDRQTEA